MEAIIKVLESRLAKNPGSEKIKKDLALEYYKESGNHNNNMCKLELYYECNSSYCEKALVLMEEFFGKDNQLNEILIKEHYNYYSHFNKSLKSYSYIPDFLKNLYKNWNNEYYDEFLYLKKVPEKFLENNPEYSYYLAYSQSDIAQKQKYLEIGKNHLPSIYGLGLSHKHNKEYTKAIEFFKIGAKKSHLPSIYSLHLLVKDINDVMTYIESIESLDNLDEDSLYIFAFSHFDIKNKVGKNNLKDILENLTSKTTYSIKIHSLLKLSPIIDKEKLRADKMIVVEKTEYKNLDGHALAILGYIAYYKKVIDNESIDMIDKKQFDKKKDVESMDKITNIGAEELIVKRKALTNYKEELHYSFAVKLLEMSIEKGYTQANLFLGKIYYANRNYVKAQEHLLESLKDGSVEAYYILGAMSLKEGRYEQSYNYFLHYSEIDPVSKYSVCIFYMYGFFVQKNAESAQSCLNKLLSESVHIRGLTHYTLAVLNLVDNHDVNKAHQHIKGAKENLYDTSYIELVINLQTKNCANVRDTFFSKREDIYFKYLEAADRLNGKCLTQNKAEAKKLAREILEKKPDDNILLDCAYTIYEEEKITDDCVHTLQHLYNFDYIDSYYTPPMLSDLFKEDFLSHIFSNTTDVEKDISCNKEDL
jgi:hypothetical protein